MWYFITRLIPSCWYQIDLIMKFSWYICHFIELISNFKLRWLLWQHTPCLVALCVGVIVSMARFNSICLTTQYHGRTEVCTISKCDNTMAHVCTQWWLGIWTIYLWRVRNVPIKVHPDNKVHGAYMGPTWGRQDPGGLHVGPMILAIWGTIRNNH